MTDKLGTKYAQNARFVGRKSVTGPLNDLALSHVVSDLQTEARKLASTDELRCNLEFSDKHLLITYIKKDEGFESDGESTKSAEAVKIVFNDDTSSANSSASDSDDLAKGSSTSTSASASPTADLAKYKFDHKESYNINDVLICHTATNNVVFVMRTKDGLEAMVIECFAEDDVKSLYKKFLDVSKRSKLERHRRRRSDGGSVVARSMEAIFNRKRDKSNDEEQRPNRFNLVQHTDRNGITHIEVEQPKSYIEQVSDVSQPHMGPSQQLVAKLRSSRSSATPGKKPSSEKSKFAKELESILSKELETRHHSSTKSLYKQRPPGESLSLRQRAPALLLRKLDEFEEKANQVWARAEAEAAEENRKIWNKPTVVIDSSKLASRTPPPTSRLKHQVNRFERDNQRKERLSRIKAELLAQADSIRPAPTLSMTSPSVTTSVTVSATSTATTTTASTTTTATPAATPTGGAVTPTVKKDDKKILVPTKTGKEPVKKLYPKDQAPEFLRQLQPLGPAPGPPGPRFMLALPSPMQFTAQPHSLPMYPVTVGPMHHPWARYHPAGPASLAPPSGDYNDTNNNMGQIWASMAVQRGHGQAPQVPQDGGGHGRGRSRDRGRSGIDGDQRRRAQSKSPARLAAINPVSPGSDINIISGGLSRKFREFGDAVRQRMSRKSATANITVNSQNGADGVDGQCLKSNLKKIDTNNADNKKVHFNKFATVQMME